LKIKEEWGTKREVRMCKKKKREREWNKERGREKER
jgi:hypothetical protein